MSNNPNFVSNDFSDDEYYAVRESRNFTGKVVLVTGSSSGIGEGIVKLFAVLGAHVVVTGRNEVEVNRVANKVQSLSPKQLKPLVVLGDITEPDVQKTLINKTIETFGKLDVLVNNAAIEPQTDIRGDNFTMVTDQTYQTNFLAPLQLLQLAIPHLELQNGNIINISTIGALLPGRYDFFPLPYGALKQALNYATSSLAAQLGPKIRVNTITPGPVLTKIIIPQKIEYAPKHSPVRRIGQPLDIAKGAVFLASSDASYITGANLIMDGGIMYSK